MVNYSDVLKKLLKTCFPVQAAHEIVGLIVLIVNMEFVHADIYLLFHLTHLTLVRSLFYQEQEEREIFFSGIAT